MIVLGLDSATAACSAALWRDGRILARRFRDMDRGQAEALVPMARDVVAEAGLEFTALDRVGVTVGPGAFTGLRIGLAAARGIALASGAELIGVTSLAAVAAAAFSEEEGGGAAGPLLVALETKRADLYVQLFADDETPMTEPFVARADAVASRLPAVPARLAGDGAGSVSAAFAAAGLAAPARCAARAPDGAVVAVLAATRAETHVAAEPIYLRPPQVTPEPGPRGRPAHFPGDLAGGAR
ncbi:MAG: tRNA (adenosine(37)-N6)-threonylcarbamoyltransferase complex dimerization subunit type 1 TsaB [Rhodospirillaceae bacterium]|nr:tRNA (adenosine(37)-N6)-threonylcarbamoyltransferase complex dimerization subunit type 1 TsaB [Rhodospirillaceae bacterium]